MTRQLLLRTLAWTLIIWPVLAFADEPVPRNIILMISDGCGFNHVDAASYYEHGRTGVQVYEHFPVRLAMSTQPAGRAAYDPVCFWDYGDCIERHPTDSAAAITAMTTGRRAPNGALCTDYLDRPLVPLVTRMETGGRATGSVSTVMFAHATPAGVAVSNPDRDQYEEISRQLLLDSGLDVLMGAGHPFFDRQGQPTEKTRFKYVGDQTVWEDLQNGVCGGDADGDGQADPWTLIETRADFQALLTGPTPRRVLGVAQVRETFQEERSGDTQADPFVVPLNPNVPTLVELALGALNVLDEHHCGFFLMIEGGAVDWAGHENQTGRMIEEQLDFNRAVEAVVGWVDFHGGWSENLVIVTADHETGYLTGPDRTDGKSPPCLFHLPLVGQGQGQVPAVSWRSDEHTNALVPFYAKGVGCDQLVEAVRGTDPVWGPYINNTDLGRLLVDLAGVQP